MGWEHALFLGALLCWLIPPCYLSAQQISKTVVYFCMIFRLLFLTICPVMTQNSANILRWKPMLCSKPQGLQMLPMWTLWEKWALSFFLCLGKLCFSLSSSANPASTGQHASVLLSLQVNTSRKVAVLHDFSSYLGA